MQRQEQRKYIPTKALGRGTYGTVFQALDERKAKVAIKKLFGMDSASRGVDPTALREVKYLRDVKHPNVIRLLDVYFQSSALHLVMEFCPSDLAVLLYDQAVHISPEDTRCYIRQLLSGVEFLHAHYLLHRDLKPGNLLLSPRGVLKLADFGLARSYGSPQPMTTGNKVMTSGYRPPEIIFGSPYYSAAADIWSVGCIIMEIALRAPLFPAESDAGQLGKIFQLVGTPSEATWPGVSKLENYMVVAAPSGGSAPTTAVGTTAAWPIVPLKPQIPPQQPSQSQQQYQQAVAAAQQRHAARVEEAFGSRSPLGRVFDNYKPARSVHLLIALVQTLLALNPLRRLTATRALTHPYFNDGPTTPPHKLRMNFTVEAAATPEEAAAEEEVARAFNEGYLRGRTQAKAPGGAGTGATSAASQQPEAKRMKLEDAAPPPPPT